ncbi:MAG: putative molybdenum carrier protein [Elusimicrobia bacterium]|nr:putative molybdenum carrier protein [Elusimicrobiota bacterium]
MLGHFVISRHDRRPARQGWRPVRLLRVISGGQTGVDRAALDVALELGLPCGGTAPKGRLAEDGRIPDRYPLVEGPSPDYNVRTEANVKDADATLILVLRKPLSGGTLLTCQLARRHRKPVAVVALDAEDAVAQIRRFLERTRPETLNVAGPRESSSPGIGDRARLALVSALGSG